MDNERINLLPPERQRALSRDYFFRLGTVVAALITALTCAAAVLLLPTYVFLAKNTATKGAHLTNIGSVLSSADEKALSAQLAAFSSDAALLVELGHAPSIGAIVRQALDVSRPGVILSGFSYTPAVLKKPGTLAISGTATTRDALRNYQMALERAPFAVLAALPVSAYAQDADIEFSITVTLAP